MEDSDAQSDVFWSPEKQRVIDNITKTGMQNIRETVKTLKDEGIDIEASHDEFFIDFSFYSEIL